MQPSTGKPIGEGLGPGQCHWEPCSPSPYLVLIDIFVPGDDDPLLDPRLRKSSFHSLQREREVRSALGPAGAAASTGDRSKASLKGKAGTSSRFLS